MRPQWQVSPLGQAFGVRSWPLVLAVFCVQAHHVTNEWLLPLWTPCLPHCEEPYFLKLCAKMSPPPFSCKRIWAWLHEGNGSPVSRDLIKEPGKEEPEKQLPVEQTSYLFFWGSSVESPGRLALTARLRFWMKVKPPTWPPCLTFCHSLQNLKEPCLRPLPSLGSVTSPESPSQPFGNYLPTSPSALPFFEEGISLLTNWTFFGFSYFICKNVHICTLNKCMPFPLQLSCLLSVQFI